jgi:hypothetical protein
MSILDEQAVYKFPASPVRATKLTDFLDTEVDGNYYLKLRAVEGILKSTFHSRRSSIQTKDYSQTLTARDYRGPACVISGNLSDTLMLKDMLDTDVDDKYYIKIGTMESVLRSKYAYNKRKIQTRDDYCHTLAAMDGSHPSCVITGELEYAVWDMLVRMTDIEHGGIPLPARNEPIIVAQRGRYPDNPSDRTAGLPTKQRLEFNRDGVCNTLTTVCKDNLICTVDEITTETYTLEDIFKGLRIRKMTEREYWRLMGWKDSEIDKVIAAGVSARQMYRQAGNGICLPVLEAIFTNLFKDGRLWN